VAVTGITGARRELPPDLRDNVARIRKHTDVPLALGFGISTPEQAAAMHGLLDGYIVGSALVRTAPDGIEAVVDLARRLAETSNHVRG
jgi:tryptophan synthase alpha chain